MAVKEVIEIQAKTGKAQSEIEKLTDKVDDLSKSQASTAKSTEGIASSIGTLTKGALIGVAIKAFESFTEVLGRNQKVADFFSTALEFVSIAFNDLVNFILDNVTPVANGFKAIFDDPLGAIKNLAQAIQNNLIERFNSFVETLGFVGDAISALFSGDFALAGELAKEAGKEMVDVFTGVDNSVDKVVDTVTKVAEATSNYVKETYRAAEANVQLEKTAEKATALNQGLIEKYDRQAEQLRQIRDEERNTLEERIAANNKLNEVLDEQEKAMLANANAILASAQAQFDKNNNQENEIALIEAQNELLAVQAQIEGFRSEQKANDLALSRELAQVDRDRAQAEIDNFRTIEEAKIELIENDTLRAQKQIELEEEVYRRSKMLLDERLALEKEGSVAYAEILNEKSTLDAEYSATKIQLAKLSTDTEVNTATEGINKLKEVVGEASIAGKALSIAEAIINTYQGATKALAQGGIFGSALAAVNIAAGLASVNKIISTPIPSYFGGGGGSFGGASISSGSTVASNVSAPSFNIVAATQQNRLLNDINAATSQPTRAYVVSKDVSTAQELERNRIKNAKF